MTEWTPSQQDAIDARGRNILVSAAAGSGKTAVLVERVIRLILDEINPTALDRLLVVTFTNAAAAEMKARISKALEDILRQHPHHTNAMRQLSLLPSAMICTIDSFCINLVRENFFQLGIQQDFKILDASQAQLIEQNAIEEIVEQLYEENDEAFKALVELFSTPKNDDGLIRAVKRIDGYISSQPFPIHWLSRIGELYRPDVAFEESPLKAYLSKEIAFMLDYLKDVVQEALDLLIPGDEMYEKYLDMLTADRREIEALSEALALPWNEMRQRFYNVSFVRTVTAGKGRSVPYKDRLLALRKIYSGSGGLIQEQILPLLAADTDAILADNQTLYPVFQSLIALVERYHRRALEMKHDISAYTFSDVEHFAIDLLFYPDENGRIQRTSLAEEYAGRFDEILVDEYQDTNAAQDTLFKMLSNGHNRFMVGDVKQSIYRFRLAMPDIFTAKKERFTPYQRGDAASDSKIVLDKNFRSRSGVCHLTNFLFSHLMSKEVGELDYGSEDYLYPAADYPATDVPSASLRVIDIPDDEEKDAYEARIVAETILNKIQSVEVIRDGKQSRPIRYGDIAVLLRSAKSSLPVFAKVFAEYGIPTVADNRLNLFENQEIVILLSLLRVIDNPVQDVPLLATLLSFFYGYTADDIAKARVKTKKGSLYAAVVKDGKRFTAFLEDLDKYKKYAATMSVESLIRQILSDTSYLSLIAALGNVEQRRMNVHRLIDIAKVFDSGESVGLTAFMRYIDAIISAGLNVESAELIAGGDNSVRIMSVHKSKGLEFPVCILAGASHKYNMEDLRESVLLNHKLGIGLKVNHEEGLYRYDSVQFTAIKNINYTAVMSENLRVLYVAVTRAKEQFIAFAGYKNAPRRIASLGSKILHGSVPPYVVKHTQCDGDLLLLCALLHRDGDGIRSYAAHRIEADCTFDFRFDIQLITEASAQLQLSTETAAPDEALVQSIREKLSFTYDRAGLSAFTAKRTASSLDEQEQSYQFFARSKPAFLEKGGMSAAQRGTAMHTFMQFCDYKNAKADLDGEIERLTQSGRLTAEQAQALNRRKLHRLFASDFAKRLFESDSIYREIKVASFVPVNELEDTAFSDTVLVQGIADCVFEEDGKLVLVDYKTDYVDSEDELLALYRRQIAFYRRAVAKTLGKEVKEAMLYSFCLDKPCIYK